jgi:hypothetical protein
MSWHPVVDARPRALADERHHFPRAASSEATARRLCDSASSASVSARTLARPSTLSASTRMAAAISTSVCVLRHVLSLWNLTRKGTEKAPAALSELG